MSIFSNIDVHDDANTFDNKWASCSILLLISLFEIDWHWFDCKLKNVILLISSSSIRWLVTMLNLLIILLTRVLFIAHFASQIRDFFIDSTKVERKRSTIDSMSERRKWCLMISSTIFLIEIRINFWYWWSLVTKSSSWKAWTMFCWLMIEVSLTRWREMTNLILESATKAKVNRWRIDRLSSELSVVDTRSRLMNY